MKKQKNTSRLRSRARSSSARPSGANSQTNKFTYYRSSSSRQEEGGRRTTKLESARSENNSRKRLLVYALVAFIAFILLELPVSSKPNIVVQNSNESVSDESVAQYETASEHILSKSFTNRTKLTLDKSNFADQLKKQLAGIDKVNVSYSPFSYHPTIYLTLASPVMILSTASGEYALSENGAVISSVDRKSKSDLPVVQDKALQKVVPGKPVLPASYIRFITDVLAQLRANNLQAKTLAMPSGLAELDLSVKGSSYMAKFNLEGDSREQVGTFLAARNYLSKHHKTPKSYLNVMVPGKAYYK